MPRAFERLAEGVAALAAAAPSLPVSARCTVQRPNARTCARRSRPRGRSASTGSASSRPTSRRERSGGTSRGPRATGLRSRSDATTFPFLAAELDALERECAAELSSGFIAEPLGRLRARILGHFAAHAGQGDFAPITCNAPWVSAVVEADGTVRPCFFHPPVGNVRTAGSLEAVLNSPGALAFRRSLDVASNPVCRRFVCNLNLREGDLDGPPARRGRISSAGAAPTERRTGSPGRRDCPVLPPAGRSSSTTREAVFFTMPLGLLAVGSHLDPARYEVVIVDGRLEDDPVAALLSQLPGAVCLGVTVLTGAPIRDAVLASRAAKAAGPSCRSSGGAGTRRSSARSASRSRPST